MTFVLDIGKIKLVWVGPNYGQGGKVDTATKFKQEARECERIAFLEREQARIDRMIAREENRRQAIAKRLEVEIRRLEGLRRA